MTTPSDNGKNEERLIQALEETWSGMEQTFQVESAPLPDWAAMVREQRRLAKRKLWKELAILWSVGIPLLGILFFLATGMLHLFYLLEAAATVTAIPLLIIEFKRVNRTARGGI
jgi:hypothetical protein